jgi:aspartyl-tRNA(Asn)/glutamyl-tRNA(Gln) amidotransferase subunit A
MSELLTIAEAAGRIATKDLSPVELTRQCLERVKRLDGTLHSFILVTEERALADAKAAEAAIMKSGPKGPLHGIPFGHKDIYCTKGIATTAHSKLLKDHVPSADATTVRLLADAGIVLMGKLATHEFAFGGPSFDLPWPPARNPWNPDHFTAGSSSGTGAAVAAGLVLGGTGSDTGGSIRGPAALCGIAGIKPTYGLCSRAGVLPLAFSLDHAGPLAWTVEDCAIILQAMAGYDPADPASANRPVPDLRAELGNDVKGLRVGVVRHFHETDNRVSDATLAGIEGALDFFRKSGATVRDVTMTPLAHWHGCNFLILVTEAWAIHEPWMRARFGDYGELLRDRMGLGAFVTGTDYVQALRRRRELCDEMAATMADLDILVTASQAGEAPRIDAVPKWATFEKPGFTSTFNLTGYPAISVCSGFGAGGLPVSIQLAAKPFQEPTLFRAAHAYEQAMPWRRKRPELALRAAA